MKLSLPIALLAIWALSLGPVSSVSPALADGPDRLSTTTLLPPAVPRNLTGGAQAHRYVPGRVLVSLKPGAAKQGAASRLGVATARTASASSIVLSVAEGHEIQTVERLKLDPAVEYAELDYVMETLSEPSDSVYLRSIWNVSRINAPDAWDTVGPASGPIVAVLDTGVYMLHPDLKDKIVPGYNFVNEDADASDDNGHGTHVAGIVAASLNRIARTAGVSPRARIMPLKVMNASGAGSTSDLARAIIWAVDRGARIINMSLGFHGGSGTVLQAIRYAENHGVLVVAAAGNSYKAGNLPIYPAAYPEVLSVAATTNSDGHASYSSSGSYVGLAAPGGDPEGVEGPELDRWIASTYWANGRATYALLAGTSQASPHVAGAAALVLSANPALTNAQVKSILESTAKDLGAPGKDDLFGYGRVDAQAAVTSARSSLPGQSAGAGPPSPIGVPAVVRMYLPVIAARYDFGSGR